MLLSSKAKKNYSPALYDRMHERLTQNADYAKRMSRIRSRTVEPVLSTLINFANMKRVHTRGMALANKHVRMASLPYNRKKLLKFNRLKVKQNTTEIALKEGKDFLSSVGTLWGLRKPILAYPNFSPSKPRL